MSVLKQFFKDTVIYGLATVLPRLMNFILVRVHTASMGTASYAENTAFYVYAAFFNVLLTFGMETSFFWYLSKNKDKAKLYTTVLIALCGFAGFSILMLLLFEDAVASFLAISVDHLRYLLVLLLLDTLMVAPFAYLRASGKALRYAGVKLLGVGVYFILNIFFLWVVPTYGISLAFLTDLPKVQYIFLANIIASLVSLLLLLPYLLRYSLVFDAAIFKQLLRYGLPIMVAGLAFVVNENLDKLLLKHMVSSHSMGGYSACYKLAVFMMLFIQAFKLGAEPFFYKQSGHKNAKIMYALIMRYFVIVAGFGLLAIVAYIDFFKSLLISNQAYWFAIEIVPYILLANLCLGIYHNLSIWYKLTDKTRYGMYISIFGAVITIIFNVVYIPIFGFMACAWATLFAYASMMVVSYFLGKKHYPVPYATGKILLYLLLSVGLMFVSFYQFRANYYISGLIIVTYIFSIGVLEKKQLQEFLKRIR